MKCRMPGRSTRRLVLILSILLILSNIISAQIMPYGTDKAGIQEMWTPAYGCCGAEFFRPAPRPTPPAPLPTREGGG